MQCHHQNTMDGSFF
ncbi:hypothetical protein Ocin01_17096 [Orchesella cincta]|uniref:Uncharacterized protein n=1 Tax=Orchesella cincta TaxID=48709 RepID=A0A1D2M9E2_ORCCI|nr:hypothetical protein Ocin01_17096 [Orchesella cincta]